MLQLRSMNAISEPNEHPPTGGLPLPNSSVLAKILIQNASLVWFHQTWVDAFGLFATTEFSVGMAVPFLADTIEGATAQPLWTLRNVNLTLCHCFSFPRPPLPCKTPLEC